MNTLFIGGFADGRIINIDSQMPSIGLPSDLFEESFATPFDGRKDKITATLYNREFLTSKNGKTYSVMFTGGGCLLQKLLDNYKPQGVPK